MPPTRDNTAFAWKWIAPGRDVGSLTDVYAAPLRMGTSTTTRTTYMAVEGGGTEQVSFATPQTSLALCWGSIDATASNLNSFAVGVDGFTLTGADLVALGASGDGSQTDPAANQLVKITGLVRSARRRFPRPVMRSSSAL
jgi:hypothetical protein